ncbi:shikimate dehydrogenase [Companilactobacillus zhongbaensis]|uniref:shikimate dehydrogenase n=1 Tax=Companilactobacillus zhongbaensis TaxID=2486009 RepID=UPI000F77A3EE|nr:shikimate dehydrogenase [Companilactobacillus zhongbaensis]
MPKALYGLIGYPAMHSKSPIMQNAAMEKLNIDAEYQAFEFAPTKMNDEIQKLKLKNIQGFNVTMPYKQAIINYLDEVDPLAKKLQSVNTVKKVADKWIGTSTDGPGFWHTIKNDPKKVIIIGTGGAARAIISSKPENVELKVFNRNSKRFPLHQKQMKELFNIDLIKQSEILKDLPDADLIINATNAGMRDSESVLSETDFLQAKKSAHVVDIIYRDRPTKFMDNATSAGLTAENGLNMLIAQGVLSFQFWFGQNAPEQLMSQKVHQ